MVDPDLSRSTVRIFSLLQAPSPYPYATLVPKLAPILQVLSLLQLLEVLSHHRVAVLISRQGEGGSRKPPSPVQEKPLVVLVPGAQHSRKP